MLSSYGRYSIAKDFKTLYEKVKLPSPTDFEFEISRAAFPTLANMFQSNEVYTLILKSAANNGDDSYTVEIKELLKGRIEIGTYTGVLSSDSFKGQYISSHGDIREVNLH